MVYAYTLFLLFMWLIGRHKSILVANLLLIYLISAICGILLMWLDPNNICLYQTNYSPLFFLLLVLLIIFDSFSHFKGININVLNRHSVYILKIANYVGWVYIPVSLLLIINVYRVMSTSDFALYRSEADWNTQGLFVGGKFLSLCFYLSYLSFVPQFLLFYIFTLHKIKPSLKIRLLLGSLTFVLTTLAYLGRDGIIFWIMNTVVFYSIFKPYYNTKIKDDLRKWGIIILSIILFPFFVISIARFSIMKEGSIRQSFTPLVSYMGQQIHIFCQSYFVDKSDVTGYDMKGLSSSEMQSSKMYLAWTFGTFVKTLVWDYGRIGAIIIAFGYNLISRTILNWYSKDGGLYAFFVLYLLYQIPFYGVFYYRQALGHMETIYVISAVFFIILSNLKRRVL